VTNPTPEPSRERALVETFALVADSLVDDYDVAELLPLLLSRCVELFPVHAGGVLLRDRRGDLHLAGTSSEEGRLLEFLQLQNDEGACLEAYQTGEMVVADDLSNDDRWPIWGPAALALGFRSVTSLPLRLRDQTIGAMNLFGQDVGRLRGEDLYAARTIAQMTTTGILQHQALRDATTLSTQLQTALDSRVAIEQAKGVLAERHDISLEEAFERLRSEARRTKRKIGELSREITAGRA
jgi:GAF domain-containing protein